LEELGMKAKEEATGQNTTNDQEGKNCPEPTAIIPKHDRVQNTTTPKACTYHESSQQQGQRG